MQGCDAGDNPLVDSSDALAGFADPKAFGEINRLVGCRPQPEDLIDADFSCTESRINQMVVRIELRRVIGGIDGGSAAKPDIS